MKCFFRLHNVFGDVSAPIASRNIPAGSLIFGEKPLLVLPLPDARSSLQLESPLDLPCIMAKAGGAVDTVCELGAPVCASCFRVLSGPRHHCSKCALPLCSYNCQLITSHQVRSAKIPNKI